MDYKINEFEGPLDLLLHLIRKQEIQIKDIKIEKITGQYLQYIEKMEELNLDIASEYLVVAAELLVIKSRAYLKTNEDEEESEIDLKEDLINRLEAYESYQRMTNEFRDLEETRKHVFTNLSSLASYQEKTKKEPHDLSLLFEALKSLEDRQELKKPLTTKVAKKGYSLEKRIKEIKKILFQKEKVNLEELLQDNYKDTLIITFLAILEMLKKNEVNIKQKQNFDPIYLSRKEPHNE